MTPEERRASRSKAMKERFKDPEFLSAHKKRSRGRMVELNKTKTFIENREKVIASNNSVEGIRYRVSIQWPNGATKARKRVTPKWVPRDLRSEYLDYRSVYGAIVASKLVKQMLESVDV